MKTVIKNSAQAPCPPLSLTRRFSPRMLSGQREVDQPPRRLSSCFNSFPGHPTESEHIRLNPTNFSFLLPRPGRSPIENRNSKFENLSKRPEISLYFTFYHFFMKLIELKFHFGDWVVLGTGRIPDRVVIQSLFQHSIAPRLHHSSPDQSDPVKPSQAQSNQIQPPPPPPGKEIGKETAKFLGYF